MILGISKKAFYAALIAVIVSIILPFLITVSYYHHVFISILIAITMGAGFNLMAGLAGQLSLGHSAFFGFGAYTAVFAIRAGSPIILSVLLGGLASALLALPVGRLLLRLRGVFFAFGTLGLAEVLRVIFLSLPALGGGSGFTVPLTSGYSKLLFYYISLTIALGAVFSTYFLKKTRFGYGLAAILGDEDIAKTTGINTMQYKIYIFAISAFFPGMAGAAYALYLLYVEPEMVYAAFISIEMQIIAIFGGLGTAIGPVIGGIILRGMREVLTFALAGVVFQGFYLLVYGLLLIIIIIFAPQGVAGIIGQFTARGKIRNTGS